MLITLKTPLPRIAPPSDNPSRRRPRPPLLPLPSLPSERAGGRSPADVGVGGVVFPPRSSGLGAGWIPRATAQHWWLAAAAAGSWWLRGRLRVCGRRRASWIRPFLSRTLGLGGCGLVAMQLSRRRSGAGQGGDEAPTRLLGGGSGLVRDLAGGALQAHIWALWASVCCLWLD